MKKPAVDEINKKLNAFQSDTMGYQLEENIIIEMCAFAKMLGTDRLIVLAKEIDKLIK